jgi:hypothetical protein
MDRGGNNRKINRRRIEAMAAAIQPRERQTHGPCDHLPTITVEGRARRHAKHVRQQTHRKYEHADVSGSISHNRPQKAPQTPAEALLDLNYF